MVNGVCSLATGLLSRTALGTSYCGVERSEKFLQDLTDQDMLQYFDKIRFTWTKCGRQGKATARTTTPFMLDDCKEIVDECNAMFLEDCSSC